VTKKSILALIIAVIIPLICYFIVKKVSDQNVVVPRHYLPDTVINKTVDGKLVSDTQWHKIPDFQLVNQLGDTVSWKDMEGKIVVADFFFTHCPTICPSLTVNMKKLQETITSGEKVGDQRANYLQFLSFSVDSERDSVAQLKKWADRFQVDPENWWLLTGPKKTIYNLGNNEFRLALVDGEGVDTSFIHTDMFVLMDKNHQVRGYYHGLDTTDLARLSEDIIFLSMEKGTGDKSFLSGKLEMLAVVFLITILLVFVLMRVLRRNKEN